MNRQKLLGACLRHRSLAPSTADRAVLLERPEVIKVVDDGELHADEGGAVIYRDGRSMRFRHGKVLENPHRKSWRYPMGALSSAVLW